MPFRDRHYFQSLDYVDPADHAAIEALVAVRKEHLRPLRQMDGCVIIDSDTGSFPGAKNDDFVALLVAHRKMLDRLRPGIELLYWMHVGWEAYGRYHATGTFEWASHGEVSDLLAKLEAADPAPWGISVHSLGRHADMMRTIIGQLAAAAAAGPTAGRLGGLVFGDPGRFLADLGMQLELRRAGVELIAASEQSMDAARLEAFVAAAERWQGTHGYQCMWNIATLPKLDEVLRKLGSARLDSLLAEKDWWSATNPSLVGATTFERHQNQNRKWDTHTVRVLAALREIADTVAER